MPTAILPPLIRLPAYAFKANIMCIMLPAISHNARQSYRKGVSIKFCRFLSYTFYFFLFLTSTYVR